MDSTSDSENKVGRGTTTISYINGDTIYIVSDGRTCSSSTPQDNLFVLKGNDKKIYKVTDKICATTAGNVALTDEMLEICAQNSEDLNKMSTKLKKHKEKHLTDMKKEILRNKKNQGVKPILKAQFGIYSVDGMNGAPCIKLIGTKDRDAFGSGSMVSSGTGGEAAREHLVIILKERGNPETHDEWLSSLKECATVSGLDDIYTGGFIQGAILSPEGLIIEEEKDHMIKHLADKHDHLIHILSTKLLCITRKFAYEEENEEAVTKFIKKQFSSVPKILLLGVHQQLIVRCLDFFKDATANTAFNNSGRGQAVLKLNSGATHTVEFKKPTKEVFTALARDFVDERDY
uniref:uncharacterized protein LOC101296413 n=1 Tax=Fragaria vesca subsp. vesca TaxID=101020 RepID=UPI0005C95269|nr:PREDICTED: uncharacterized protein LOC101296413 [Fragaria vesca subsp. vesca]